MRLYECGSPRTYILSYLRFARVFVPTTVRGGECVMDTDAYMSKGYTCEECIRTRLKFEYVCKEYTHVFAGTRKRI